MDGPGESEESEESGGPEDSMQEDADYAIVGDTETAEPEPSEAAVEKRPVRIGDRGIVLRTSRLSYLYTYVLAALVVVFIYMAGSRFGLAFTMQPQSLAETANSAVFALLVAASAFLFVEADIERLMRQYMITNTDVVKAEGIIRKRRVIIPYQSVSNVSVYKGVLGRMLGFGDVDVVGFDADIRMRGIRDPDTFYRIVNNKIARMRGVGAAAVMPAAEFSAEAGGERASVDWRSEQRELESRVRQPAVPAAEKKESIFGMLKRRVQSKPAEQETKEAKPKRRKVVRRAKRKARG